MLNHITDVNGMNLAVGWSAHIISGAMLGCLILFTSAIPADAASITKIDSHECTARLSNDVVQGDLDKLRVAGLEGGTLCLDSPGGSYAEALKLAEYVHTNGIQTAVGKGAQCFSACALIFMAGTAWQEQTLVISRRLHVLGQLGFHAPFLHRLEKRPDPASLEIAYRAGLAAIGKLLDLAKNSYVAERNSVLPIALLAEMLQKGPEESFDIDTVKKAIQFEISLDGVPEKPLTAEAVCTACSSLHPLFPFSGCWNETRVVTFESSGGFSTPLPGPEEGASLQCTVSPTSEYEIVAVDRKPVTHGHLEPWHLYPANMPIRMLAEPIALASLADQLPALPKVMERLNGYRVDEEKVINETMLLRYNAPGATLERCELHCILDDQCTAYELTAAGDCQTYSGSPILRAESGSRAGVRLEFGPAISRKGSGGGKPEVAR